MSHRNLAVLGSFVVLLVALTGAASAQSPDDPPHWLYGTGQTKGHVVAIAGTDLSGVAFSDGGFWVIETTASVADAVGPDSFTVNGVLARATLERYERSTRVTLPRTDFDPPSLAWWDLGPVDPDTTYSLAAGDGWRLWRIPRPGLETLHATCIQGSGEVWQQVGETQGWTRSAPEQLMRLALTLHRDSVHELFASDLSSICGVEAVPLFTVATGPLVDIAAYLGTDPLGPSVLISGGHHSNGWWAQRIPLVGSSHLSVACLPGSGAVHARIDHDGEWSQVAGEHLMVMASAVRHPRSQEMLAERVTDICEVDTATHLATNHASLAAGHAPELADPPPLDHFGFTEPEMWETNMGSRGAGYWAFQIPRTGMSTLYSACYEDSGIVHRWTGAGWVRSTASELLSMAVNLRWPHEYEGFEWDLGKWCNAYTEEMQQRHDRKRARLAQPCWQPQWYDPGEYEEVRIYRWGWYSFAHSCEPGVSAGLAVLDRLEAREFIHRVYLDYPELSAPRLEWNRYLPGGWSGNFRTPDRVIEFPLNDTGVFNLLHEIAHDIDDLNGYSAEDHGPEFRSVLLCLVQRFVWDEGDVTRLTAHAQQSARDLEVHLSVDTDGSKPCR